METKYVAERFSDLIVGTQYSALPEEATDHVKLILLDYLGSLIGARILESTPKAIALAEELGGRAECTVVGSAQKVDAANAALANGIEGYSFDFIDDHNDSKAHTSAATIPAALSLCEKYHRSGRELIEAIAVGNETVARLGAAYLGTMVKQSFHPTAVLATFGAAAAASRCMGLDREQTTHAQSLAAACMAGGLYAWNSGNNYAKRVNAGHPARNGILAAQMAEHGFLGPLDVYEGPFGAFNAFSHDKTWSTEPVFENFGEVWSFANSSIKPYPCCRYGGPNIDAVLEILKEHTIDLNEIREIVSRTQSAQIELLMDPPEAKYHPASVVDMQFSLPYQLAITLIRGKATVDEFDLECLNEPMLQHLMSLVRAEVDPELEARYPGQYSSSVVITMKNGEQYSAVIDDPLGDWRNPVTTEFVIEKFRYLAAKSIGDPARIDRIVDMVFHLEELGDTAELMEIINYAAT